MPTSTPKPQSFAALAFMAHVWTAFALGFSNTVLALSGVAATRVDRHGWVGWRGARRLLIPATIFFLSMLCSTIASSQPEVSWSASSRPLGLFALPLCLYLIRDRQSVQRMIDGLILMAFLASLLGLGQGIAWGLFDLQRRPSSPFPHYMTFSGVLLLADLLLLTELAFRPKQRSAWRWLALVSVNLALLATLTRGAWIGLLVPATILLALKSRRWLAAILVAAVLIVLLAPAPVRKRLESIVDIGDESTRDRIRIIAAGTRMLGDRPFLGHGPGTVPLLYERYRSVESFRSNVNHLHSSFLQIAVEQGLIGLAAYLWLLLAALHRCWTGFRREVSSQACSLYLGIGLATVGFVVAGLFENNWGDAEVHRLAVVLLAAPFCMALSTKAETNGARPLSATGSSP